MTIHVSMDTVVDWVVVKYLENISQLNQERIDRILPVKKYNFLVTAFNASTVALVGSAVSAVFVGLQLSFVLLAFGSFARFIAQREIDRYAGPLQGSSGVVGSAVSSAASSLGLFNRNGNILDRTDAVRVRGWEENVLVFDENIALWKATVDERLDRRR